MNKDNFCYRMQQFFIEMSQGKLCIDGVEFEENDDDATYTFAREMAKAKGLYHE